MSHPFLIWTMQRTGGTALTDLLMTMSEHRRAEHEPFNWARRKPRQFWPIAEAWNDTGDAEALDRSLSAVLADRFLIKHCYELLSMPFNLHLLQAAARTGYRHVHLVRRDELARLMSKFIAEAQGTWFKDYSSKVFAEVVDGERDLGALPSARMVEHFHHCRNAAALINAALQRLGLDCTTVFYEDLYVGDREPRLARLLALLSFLGFTAEEVARHRDGIEDTLFHAGQNTRAVAPFVPNLDEVVAALAAAGCPGAGPAAPHATMQDSTTPRARTQDGVPLRGPARVAAELARMARDHQAWGPFLEIGGGAGHPAALDDPSFRDAERQVLDVEPGGPGEAVTNDMRALFDDARFGTVIWNGTIAHDRFFWRTLEEVRRVLSPGGLLLVAAPGFSRAADRAGARALGAKGNAIADATVTQRVQGPRDYWRFSPRALRESVMAELELLELRTLMMPPRLFAVGRKAG